MTPIRIEGDSPFPSVTTFEDGESGFAGKFIHTHVFKVVVADDHVVFLHVTPASNIGTFTPLSPTEANSLGHYLIQLAREIDEGGE